MVTRTSTTAIVIVLLSIMLVASTTISFPSAIAISANKQRSDLLSTQISLSLPSSSTTTHLTSGYSNRIISDTIMITVSTSEGAGVCRTGPVDPFTCLPCPLGSEEGDPGCGGPPVPARPPPIFDWNEEDRQLCEDVRTFIWTVSCIMIGKRLGEYVGGGCGLMGYKRVQQCEEVFPPDLHYDPPWSNPFPPAPQPLPTPTPNRP